MVLSLASAGVPVAAQERGVVFQEVVDVTVVELEVVVTDRQGRPVTDLQKGDFELFEDGKRVKISNFSVIRPAPTHASQPSAPPRDDGALPAPLEPAAAQDGSFLVIYLDGLHLRPHNRARVVAPLAEFLAANPEADRRLMVVTFDGALEVELPFTDDVESAAAAVERALARSPVGTRQDVPWEMALEQMGEIFESGKVECGLNACPCVKDRLVTTAEAFAAQVRSEVENSLRALGETVNSLAGLPGRRAVLYVSDGLALEGGQGLFATIDNWCPFAGGADLASPVSYQRSGSFSSLTVLDDLTAHASRNGVVLYTFQASGLPIFSHIDAGSDEAVKGPPLSHRALPSSFIDTVRRMNLQDTLTSMADETGGLAFLDGKDVTRSLEAVDRDLNFRYSLGYLPKRGGDRRDHRLKVRVKRDGVRVRHRRSHRDFSNWERMANRTLGTLWYRTEFNPLRAEIAFGASAEVGQEAHNLPILLRVPLESLQLLPDGDDYIGQLSLFFAAEDAAGRKSSPVHATVPVRVPALHYLEAYRHRIEHPVTLMLRPGTNRLSVGAWDEVGQTYSVLYREVEVPGPSPPAAK